MSWFQKIINWFKHLFDWLDQPPGTPATSPEPVDDMLMEDTPQPEPVPEPEEPPVVVEPSEEPQVRSPEKKALLVGVDEYNDPKINLQGCVADVEQMRDLLISKGFSKNKILILKNQWATKKNILDKLEEMIINSKAGDELVFHFSGHGSQVTDLDGDEGDNLDEILIPHDLSWNGGYISDDDVARIFKKLPDGVFLSMISDSCHSGTISRNVNTMVRYITPPAHILQAIFTTKGLVLNPIGLRTDGGAQRHVLVTGCKSTQTSMSSVINNEWHGVLTYFFTAAAEKGGTWIEVFNEAVKNIKAHGFEQDPQLTGGDNILNRQVFGG